MTTRTEGLRIVRLEAENFKRLKAVDITPDPEASTVVIAGRNAQGKSSVIDSIWAALANAAANKGTGTTRPIRDGEASARVSVDLGDLVVTRTWHGDEKTKLTVSTADGARFTSPQKMLDELIGRLSFDPLSFAQLPPKQQATELQSLVDLPFDQEELAAERAALFSERTDVGRTVKQLQGQLAGIPKPSSNLPAEEQSASALLHAIRVANEMRLDLAGYETAVEQTATELERAERLVAVARERNTQAVDDLSLYEENNAIPSLADIEALETQAEQLDDINAAIREQQQRGRITAKLAAREAEYEQQSKGLAELDAQRVEGLAAAEFPVDGLGFDQGGVTYNGVPFGQASAAEQLRVSVAIAMTLNPKVRVIRITDGSLLDSDNLALISEMAEDRGYQVWIERVADSAESGVIIEDGQVQA